MTELMCKLVCILSPMTVLAGELNNDWSGFRITEQSPGRWIARPRTSVIESKLTQEKARNALKYWINW